MVGAFFRWSHANGTNSALIPRWYLRRLDGGEIIMRLTLTAVAALIAMLTPGAAAAAAEPIIIIINSHYNLLHAEVACSDVANAEGIAECKFFSGRNLGRKLENEVRSQMATNTRCQGVDEFRLNDYKYDGEINLNELADQMKQAHWTLFLGYNPGQTIHIWTLFPWTGGVTGGEIVHSGMVSGEGTVSQIADKICIAVKKQGANIR
jgi:hypothetical protein